MKIKTIFLISILLILFAFILNYNISTLEHAVVEGEIVKVINLTDRSKIVISQTDISIHCNRYEKGISGWHKTHFTGPALGTISKPFSLANVKYFYLGMHFIKVPTI
ncbi:MAG: hypothetical protein IMZ47_03920, partial [Firmicutes bacterium]|nr:hypothetical protein [Bacillota bacterium]